MDPLRFHGFHGKWVWVSEDRSVLRRYVTPNYKGGIAFSNRPVNIGEKVRLRLLKDGDGWLGFITFGFTKHNPDDNICLPEDINSATAKRAGFWTVLTERLFCQEDDVIFFFVNSSGIVQYGVNDINKGTFSLNEECDRIQLWAMVDINVDGMMVQLVDTPPEGAFEPVMAYEDLNLEGGLQNILPPLSFHTMRGDFIKVSPDGSTARRRGFDTFGGRFRHNIGKWNREILSPLRFYMNHEAMRSHDSTAEHVVRASAVTFSARAVTVNEKICLRFMDSSEDITFGFTKYDPANYSNEIPEEASSLLQHWGVSLDASLCHEDNILYYYVTSTGDICFGVNDKDLGVYFSAVDTEGPVWAIFVLSSDAIVQFVDSRTTRVGPPTPTLFPTHMRFHPVHGTRATISLNGSEVNFNEGGSTAFTYRPIRSNEQMSLRIVIPRQYSANSCRLIFGFLNSDPSSRFGLNNNPDRAKIFLRRHKTLLHIFVDSSGDVHFWCDDDIKTRCLSSMDSSSRSWMFIKTNMPSAIRFLETTTRQPPCGYTYNLKPLEFHYSHGRNLIRRYSGVQCVKGRTSEECCEGVAFSSRPIELNKKICLRILAIPDQNSEIKIGVTTIAPGLPSRIFQDPSNLTRRWTTPLENRFCIENNNIYFYVNSSGEIRYGVNGEEVGVLLSGVDISADLWAIVDISGLSTIVLFTNAFGIRQIPPHVYGNLVDDRINAGTRRPQPNNEENIEEDMEPEGVMDTEGSLRFHTIRGQNVRISQDGYMAQLVDEEDFRSGFAFTNRPISVDDQLCLRIKNYEYTNCLLIFGFTNSDPANLADAVRENSFKPHLAEVSLPSKATLYIRMSSSGDVHFWSDDYQYYTKCFSGIGANRPVWMLIELPDMPATVNFIQPRPSCQPPFGAAYNHYPLYFHSVHGRNVKVYTKMIAEVECMYPSKSYRDGVAFSSRPICENEKVYLRITSIFNTNEVMDIQLGYTNHDPESLAGPSNICKDLTNITGYWSKSLGKEFYENENDICFYVNSSGDVHYEVNGEDKGFFFRGVDLKSPLWAVMEISGRVTLMLVNGVGRFRFDEHTTYSCLIDDAKIL